MNLYLKKSVVATWNSFQKNKLNLNDHRAKNVRKQFPIQLKNIVKLELLFSGTDMQGCVFRMMEN
mgnify:CR=1 FL=1